MNTKISKEDISVRVSVCKECNGWVRAAVESEMTSESSREFHKECQDRKLEVKIVKLNDWTENKQKYCSC